jgi:hypothetical protein
VLAAVSLLSGCRTYEVPTPYGPARATVFGTDSKLGKLVYNPSTGEIVVEDFSQDNTALDAIDKIIEAAK